MIKQQVVKNLMYAVVLIAAVLASFVCYLIAAADAPAGTHPPRPVGLPLARAAIFWVAVIVINRWRKKP